MSQSEAFSRVKIEQVEHRDPVEILDEPKAIEVEILEEVEALADRLREGRAVA